MSDNSDSSNASAYDAFFANFYTSQWLPFDLFMDISLAVAISTAVFIVFGCVSNIINAILFRRLGLNSTTNICFFSLAIIDLLSLLYTSLVAVNNFPIVPQKELYIELRDLCVILSPCGLVSYGLGSWVTAIINVERACAVVFPFKVKQIFTKRSVTIAILANLAYSLVTAAPYYFSFGLSPTTIEGTNKTKMYMDPEKHKPLIGNITSILSFTGPNYICSVVVIIGTIFLIVKFKQSRRLQRKITVEKKGNDEASAKDARLIKSVIVICVIYIVGFSVGASKHLATAVYPRLYFFDPYLGTISALLSELKFLFQAVSCSVNIFVYLAYNTNYKIAFKNLLGLEKDKTVVKK